MAFKGHICYWHIFCNNMANKCCSLLIFDGCVVAVMWVYILDTVELQWDTYVQFGSHVSSGVYLNNVKCMYSSNYGHFIDCIEFI